MSPMAPVDKTSKNAPKDSSGKADKKPRQQQASSQSTMEALTTYLKGVRSEWTKVSWPTWPQIWGQTIVVLVMVSIMSLGLYLLDNTYHLLIEWMPGKS